MEYKALGLASLSLVTALSVSACVATVADYYDDDYYPYERTVVVEERPVVVRERPVIVRERRPVVVRERPVYRQRVEAYAPRQEVVVQGVKHHRRRHVEQTAVVERHRPHHEGPVVVHSRHPSQSVTVEKNNKTRDVALPPGDEAEPQRAVIERP